MRVRVELRRNAGRFIARWVKTTGATGEMVNRRKAVWDRQVPYLTIYVEPRQGYPNENVPGPELFEPKVTAVTDDGFCLMGWEITPELCWCVQEWDCTVLDIQRPGHHA